MSSSHPHNALPSPCDPSGYCPNPACGKFVQFEETQWKSQNDMVWPYWRSDMELSKPFATIPDEYIRIHLWLCPACQEACVVFTRFEMQWHEVDEEEFPPYPAGHRETPQLVWPSRRPRELEQSVPERIRGLFSEGSVAEYAGALRAAAALYRATVEELCADLGAQGNNLKMKIENLKTKGITEEMIADLHEARFLGNWSLHEGLAFSADEVADVADLIVEATTVLYVQPAERARMRAARRARRNRG